MEKRVPARLTSAQGRKFGFTVGIAFMALSGLSYWRGHLTPSIVAASLGGILLLGGLIVPTALGPVERAWMGLAHLISKVTTPVLMGIVDYLVVVPIGLVMKLLRRNPLRLAEVDGSFWASRKDDEGARGGMHRQF